MGNVGILGRDRTNWRLFFRGGWNFGFELRFWDFGFGCAQKLNDFCQETHDANTGEVRYHLRTVGATLWGRSAKAVGKRRRRSNGRSRR